MNGRFLASIGATHPWNTAGVGVDARIASEYGFRHAAAIAGVTAQDERGLHAVFALPASIVRAQLESLPLSQIVAFRVGALFDRSNVSEIAQFFERASGKPLVVDPVFSDSFGAEFANDDTVDAFRTSIAPLPGVLTPNLSEAERLTGKQIETVEGMVDAARVLQARGPHAVLIKGGHLHGDPVDVLATAQSVEIFSDTRVPKRMRGTGCTLAAVLACELALGKSVVEAVRAARAYVRRQISLS